MKKRGGEKTIISVLVAAIVLVAILIVYFLAKPSTSGTSGVASTSKDMKSTFLQVANWSESFPYGNESRFLDVSVVSSSGDRDICSLLFHLTNNATDSSYYMGIELNDPIKPSETRVFSFNISWEVTNIEIDPTYCSLDGNGTQPDTNNSDYDNNYYDIARTTPEECEEWFNDEGYLTYKELDSFGASKWDWWCKKWDANTNSWVAYGGSQDACNYRRPVHRTNEWMGCVAYGKKIDILPPSPITNVSVDRCDKISPSVRYQVAERKSEENLDTVKIEGDLINERNLFLIYSDTGKSRLIYMGNIPQGYELDPTTRISMMDIVTSEVFNVFVGASGNNTLVIDGKMYFFSMYDQHMQYDWAVRVTWGDGAGYGYAGDEVDTFHCDYSTYCPSGTTQRLDYDYCVSDVSSTPLNWNASKSSCNARGLGWDLCDRANKVLEDNNCNASKMTGKNLWFTNTINDKAYVAFYNATSSSCPEKADYQSTSDNHYAICCMKIGASSNQTNQTTGCTDGDGGENYNVKGTLSLNLVTKNDYCWNVDNVSQEYRNVLREYSCVLNQNPLNPNIIGYGGPSGTGYYEINYNCPNGCSNGACLSSSNQTNETQYDTNYYDIARTTKEECLEWFNDVGYLTYKSLDAFGASKWDWWCKKWDAASNAWIAYGGDHDSCTYYRPIHRTNEWMGCVAYGKKLGGGSNVTNQTNDTCSDSDNGWDYFTKGTCYDSAGNRFEDSCIIGWDSNIYLRDAKCANSGSGMACLTNNYVCPYGCKNGACLVSLSTPVYTDRCPEITNSFIINMTQVKISAVNTGYEFVIMEGTPVKSYGYIVIYSPNILNKARVLRLTSAPSGILTSTSRIQFEDALTGEKIFSTDGLTVGISGNASANIDGYHFYFHVKNETTYSKVTVTWGNGASYNYAGLEQDDFHCAGISFQDRCPELSSSLLNVMGLNRAGVAKTGYNFVDFEGGNIQTSDIFMIYSPNIPNKARVLRLTSAPSGILTSTSKVQFEDMITGEKVFSGDGLTVGISGKSTTMIDGYNRFIRVKNYSSYSVVSVTWDEGATYDYPWITDTFYCGYSGNQTCTNECTGGTVRCNGNYKQTCGEYDNDGCYEWGGDTYCQIGCSNGACITTNQTSNQTSPSCTDTDYGKILGIKGRIYGRTYAGELYDSWDYCSDSNNVVEGYCEGNTSYKESYNCPSGNACSNGACIASPEGYDTNYYDIARTTKAECQRWFNSVGYLTYKQLDTWPATSSWDWWCKKYDDASQTWIGYGGDHDSCTYYKPIHRTNEWMGCVAYGKKISSGTNGTITGQVISNQNSQSPVLIFFKRVFGL